MSYIANSFLLQVLRRFSYTAAVSNSFSQEDALAIQLLLPKICSAILEAVHEAKATGFRLGLLVNFGSKGKLEHERIVR